MSDRKFWRVTAALIAAGLTLATVGAAEGCSTSQERRDPKIEKCAYTDENGWLRQGPCPK